MLSGYLEAGGSTQSFRRETPRTTMMTVRAYRRRRGWSAWMTSALGRFEFPGGHPSMDEVMGQPKRQPPNAADIEWHNAKIFAALTGAKVSGR
ncbi:hypothetical protein ACFQ1E_17325 [Sphingomonas canadensis]|uniref:Uncharacterized protein n=1 Tax=Sphingomonas canadensis TaxID=1219257 RepID=A0ABW3HD16_9SPHN|nr:hypothetical protein [Sphingomonas canadensis]MCW3837809.1 hypothetical protein [Sphingomonas canadensis]